MPPKKELPAKERALFKRLIQEYETKKYKLGLKTADAILKKFPEAGETLCMKGLILATMEQRAEGLELARKGVRHDIGSFLAWHALGILQRMDKNWNEAVKCYSMALRIEGGSNVNLMREISYLHMQLRNYPAFVESRLNLLKVQPHLRMNWVALATAHHLAGSLEQAVRVLERYEETLRDVPARSYEHSEVLLYHASILFEAARYADMLEFFSAREAQTMDPQGVALLRARAYLATGASEKAEMTYETLLKRNGEDRSVVEGWLSAKGVKAVSATPEEAAAAAKALTELSELLPKSAAARRVALVYLQGDEFRSRVATYIQSALQKGVPSIFADVYGLYKDDEKRRVVEEIVEGFREEWAPSESAADQEEPSSYLWSLYFLAQHYSKLGNTDRALVLISSAIAHSPTMPELHMMRARILKRAGDLHAAAHAMEDARTLDGQDRFLNCKAAKYQLRIGRTAEASKIVGLFTKADAPDPVADLLEMQAFWYLAEEADAWIRTGNFAMALKRLDQIDRTFDEIYDDQLDFHSYCMRKFTLRSYASMVRWEDQLRSHPAYFRAALTTIKLYTRLHDEPALAKGGSNGTNGELTDEQRKEAKKAKRAELRAAEDAKKNAAKPKVEAKKADDDELPGPPKDEDPTGSKRLAALNKPLVAATSLLAVLQERAATRVETWLATFEVASRQRNWLLAARALTHAQRLEPQHPEVHRQTVLLLSSLPDLAAAPAPVRAGIETAKAQLLPQEQSLEALSSTYVQAHPASGAHLLGGARALLALRGDAGRADALAMLQQLPRAETQLELPTLVEALGLLPSFGADDAARAEFVKAAHERFPRADAFKDKALLQEEEKQREEERAAWAASKDEAEGAAEAGSAPTQK